MSRWAALACLAALAGCAVGPDYRTPRVATPQRFVEQAQVPAAGAADLSRWWAQFGDPELDSLITRALRQNLDLESAVSRVREAREQVRWTCESDESREPQASGRAATTPTRDMG